VLKQYFSIEGPRIRRLSEPNKAANIALQHLDSSSLPSLYLLSIEALVKISFRSFRTLSALSLFLFSTLSALSQTRLVISQMYGGGGNSGAPYTYDFLELFNPTSSAIDLTGYSIQYVNATGTAWNAVALPSASVAPGHYYLIQAAAGTTVTGVNLPVTPDFTTGNGSTGNPLNFSATAGKIAIVNNTTPLTTDCPLGSTVVAFLGFGTTADCFEGTGPAPAPSNTTADIRTNPTVDNINNATDFVTGAPNPHNSGSAGPAPPVAAAIHDIQGVKSTTAATISPLVGQQVTTTGIVTAVLSNGFFIQSRDVDADSNPLTPEGIDVFTTAGHVPAIAAIGNYVQVTGTVATFPAATASHTPATEITSPTVTLISTGNPLPTPIPLTASMLTASGGLYQLTPYEGMRVSVASMTATSGTNGSITAANEAAEIATSTGYFYAVITGTARPFREPGIDIRDTPIPGAPTGIAQFDDNPERILVDSTIAGGTSIEISTGAVLANVTGVLDFTFSSDSFYDPSRLILDFSYNRNQVAAGMTVQPIPATTANQFTVASFNIERFYNTNSADDLYYVPSGVTGFNGNSSTGTVSTGQTFTSAAVDVVLPAYTRRLQKLSLAIRTVLNTPDIVTLEEVENQSVANDIATQINTDAGIPNLYTAYSTDNTNFYTQDGTGISVGFLVKNSTVDSFSLTQVGQKESFTPTSSTSPITLNDRPWLALSAGIKRGINKDYPVTVVVNHMKALSGVNSTTSTSTRQKKEFQAEEVAKFIQTLQANGQHVISGGDFNAFEFSDGYTDTLATYTNTNVLPSTKVVQAGTSGLVTPPLTDLALSLPANQRWSYVEDGNAQILDHIVVTPELAAGAQLVYAHLDADFPVTAYNDASTAARSSDHDVPVGYFAIPAPVNGVALNPSASTFPSTLLGVHSNGQTVNLINIGETPLTITSITATGPFAASNSCGGTLALGATCAINVVFTPTAIGAATGQLQVITSASTTPLIATLTGTGALTPDFTLADSTGKTSTSVTVAAGSSVAASLVVTPNAAFTGTVTITCAASGTAPTGVSCAVPAPFALNPTIVATTNVSFSTTSRTTTSGFSLTGNRSRSITTLTLAIAGLLMLLVARTRRLGKLTVRAAGLFTLLLAICIPAIGCGHKASTPTTTANPLGTPAGTYTYTVTATSGTITHTETVTLTVN
jgi:predicted extracellular nuclease